MKQFFQEGSKPSQLVVIFHGAGSNKYQLLTTIVALYPEAGVLNYLGTEGASEQRRSFAPLVNGALPRTNFGKQVIAFLEETWQPQKLYDEVTFIGYSNSVNFILGLLERNPTIASTAILLHPSNLGYQYVSDEFATEVIIMTKARDELGIPRQVLSPANRLKKYFPVDFLLVDNGHDLSEEEVTEVKEVL